MKKGWRAFWSWILVCNFLLASSWYWFPSTLPESVSRGDAAIVGAIFLVGSVLFWASEATE